MRLLISFITLFILNFSFAQQNEEFRLVKNYFDQQRFMVNNQFKKRFDEEKNNLSKINIKKDFAEFMRKMDSVQNTALVSALIKVKNREDLENLGIYSSRLKIENPPKSKLTEEARYPGGFENLREQIATIFYSGAVKADRDQLSTNVDFVVESDGSISSVHAEGDNFTFNRQAEIAMYLLPQKFSPALIKGNAVRYKFRLPLAMSFEP